MRSLLGLVVLSGLATSGWAADKPAGRMRTPAMPVQKILTPKPGPEPRINGPAVFGVRPGHPFLYRIPTSGARPMEFAVEGLPAGLSVDPTTGQISGQIMQPGESRVILKAKNALGESRKKLRILVGEKIALTPPMGWNSWYCYQMKVNQEKVLQSARTLARSGLVDHGWTYVNVDDTWQGRRTGTDHALQANEKFPNMKAMCDEIHALGLKAGIYSTPWITSYAHYCGGTSNNPDGAWSPDVEGKMKIVKMPGKERLGQYSFAQADARQWAQWGFDFMKYDWYPNDLPHVIDMSKALRTSGRDMVFSLSNKALLAMGPELTKWANMWRTSGDISDAWDGAHVFLPMWSYCISEVAFSEDRWAPFSGPGHWNDPDVMPVGVLGANESRPCRLTPDEQYSLVSMWCMLSAPLLIGGDPEKLDAFTLNLLTNDEVLAINQDALGVQATKVAADGPVDLYKKPLEDGAVVLGLFNRDSAAHTAKFNKFFDIGLGGQHHVRDLWRQKDLADVHAEFDGPGSFVANLPAHGVLLVKLTRAEPSSGGPGKK